MKAVAPESIPTLPPGATGWARSTHREGTLFHAHDRGQAVCNLIFLRKWREAPEATLGAMQYHGICPRCYRKVPKEWKA